MKKLLSLPVIALLLTATIGFAAAFTIINLTPLKISIFGQQIEDSQFTVVTQRLNLKKNRITVTLLATNGDVSEHSANITVSLYGSGDSLLAETWQLTGAVAGGDGLTLTYDFDVSRDDYVYYEALVEDVD